MKKIVSFIIMPMMFIFIIWCIVFMTTIDSSENMSQYHIDLYTMFSRFGEVSGVSYGFKDTFNSFITNMKSIVNDNSIISQLMGNSLGDSNGWTIILTGIESLLNPIKAIGIPLVVLGYLIALIVELLIIITVIATAIFDFIFTPVFIHV